AVVTTVPADLAAKTTVVATGGTTADPPVEAVAVASVATIVTVTVDRDVKRALLSVPAVVSLVMSNWAVAPAVDSVAMTTVEEDPAVDTSEAKIGAVGSVVMTVTVTGIVVRVGTMS
ncbi:hypothetical protein PUR30_06640, partial [Streptomyces sp. JV190]|nr:hypothetical protein [Streptomyces sp. JV190]